MDQSITLNEEAFKANSVNNIDGTEAYYLSPTFKRNEKFITNINERKIITLNFQKNLLRKTDLNNNIIEEEYGEVSVGETDTYRKGLSDAQQKAQPYITFRLKLDNKMKVTHITMKGSS